MTFSNSANRMVISDTDGHVVFDTDERLFVVTNGPYSGRVNALSQNNSSGVSTPVSVPRYVANSVNGNINQDRDTTLASINPSADTVRGAFSVSIDVGFPLATTPTPALSALGWFNASGTYINFLGATWNPSGSTQNNYVMNSLQALTFIASGGSLIFNERTRLVYPANTSTSSFTATYALQVDYHLFCGAFV